jgi:hypothetical protein
MALISVPRSATPASIVSRTWIVEEGLAVVGHHPLRLLALVRSAVMA